MWRRRGRRVAALLLLPGKVPFQETTAMIEGTRGPGGTKPNNDLYMGAMVQAPVMPIRLWASPYCFFDEHFHKIIVVAPGCASPW